MIEGRPDNWRIKCVGSAFDFHMITDMKPAPKMPFVGVVNDLSSEDGQKIENGRYYWVRNEGDA
jgi:hypothetical protein